MRHRQGTWGGGWLLTVTALLILVAGCGGTASVPAGGSQSAGSGLGGEMVGGRGVIQGNIGVGNQTVRLFLTHFYGSEECTTTGDPEQITASDANGSFVFEQAVSQEPGYCIEYGGNTYVCNCSWSESGGCPCSPPPPTPPPTRK
jgi:hypothetical protein